MQKLLWLYVLPYSNIINNYTNKEACVCVCVKVCACLHVWLLVCLPHNSTTETWNVLWVQYNKGVHLGIVYEIQATHGLWGHPLFNKALTEVASRRNNCFYVIVNIMLL